MAPLRWSPLQRAMLLLFLLPAGRSAAADSAVAVAFSWDVNAPEETLLTPEYGAARLDATGTAVAINVAGDRVLVGATGRNEVLVIQREICDGPCWTPSGVLNGDAYGGINFDARLGSSVSCSADGVSAVVGAPGDGAAGELAGSTFVYEESGGIWRTAARLLATDAAATDLFGCAVAMSPDGQVVVVGARGRDELPSSGTFRLMDSGAAYVFVRGTDSRGTNGWLLARQQKLLASDGPIRGDGFGSAVAIASSGMIVVGAPNHNEGAGAVYVYRTVDGEHWLPGEKLAVVTESLVGAPPDANRPGFGNALSFSIEPPDTLLVSASADTPSSVQRNAGAVYVYTRRLEPDGSESWIAGHTLFAGSAAKAYDFFGHSVAVSADGSSAVVGAHMTDIMWFDAESGDSGLTANTGMSYFFTLVNTTTCGSAQRHARAELIQGCKDDEQFRDQYGFACSLWTQPGYEDCKTAASVHYYSLNGQADILDACLETCGRCDEMDACALDVIEQMVLQASDAAAGDFFGAAVAVSGDGTVVIVGAPTADMPEPSCDPTLSDCGEGVSLGDPTDHGIAYAYVNACPKLIINHSTASADGPCFAPVRGGECFFQCGQGYKVASNASKASKLAAVMRPRAFGAAPHQTGAIACHGMGRMTAMWDHAECVEVSCPQHSSRFYLLEEDNSYAGRGKACRCDEGYSGEINWNITSATWVGKCVAVPCDPVYVPHSDRAVGTLGGLGPCRAVTAQSCSYRCDASYRAHSGRTETGREFRAHEGYTEAPGMQGQTAPSAIGRALCTPAGVFIHAGCFSVPCPMHGQLVQPERKHCICDEGFAGDVTWLPEEDEGTLAVWSEPCEGEWVVSGRVRCVSDVSSCDVSCSYSLLGAMGSFTARAWLFNILAVGLAIGGGFKVTQHYQKHHKGKTARRDPVSKRQQMMLGCTDAAADAASTHELLSMRAKEVTGQTMADLVAVPSSSPELTVPKHSEQEQEMNESLPGQLESPERRPRAGSGPQHPDTAPPPTASAAKGGKLVLPPLRLSRKTGAAYYVDKDGKSVWASALPFPPDSLLAADGNPWRDVYHSGPFHATHMDNLACGKDDPPEREAP